MPSPMLRIYAALAVASTAIALAVAIIGLPYGRLNYTAFAELYHNGTDTTGFVHVAIDCLPTLPGTQDTCDFDSGMTSSFDVAITVGNSTAAPIRLSAFNFTVNNPNLGMITAPTIDNPGNADDNPNFDQASWGGTYNCGVPMADATPGLPEDSVLWCNTGNGDGPVIANGLDHLTLATIRYNVLGPTGSVPLSLQNVNLFDDAFVEVGSCNPIVTTAAQCFGAGARLSYNGGCWPNDHDCDGHQDVMVLTHVGPSNTDPNYDNCPFYPNGQGNQDGNFIEQHPVYAVDDRTRANSDAPGDACDPDADNDGRLASGSGIEAPCNGSGTLYPWDEDTDDDRVLDGAECTLGSNPTDPLSKPAPPAPGTDSDGDGLSDAFETTIGTNPNSKDTDGDKLQDGWEYKGYNTNPLSAETDGGGIRDGCEVASLNTDTVVNVGDQAILSAELARAVPPSQKLANMDLNKDGAINPGDQAFQASMIGPGTCP